MSSKIPRRDFILKSSAACMGGCMLFAGKEAMASYLKVENIDPEKLCYCSYSCPTDCHFLVASVNDDSELKKAAFREWGLAEHYGMEFDAGKVFCFKCKPGNMPEGPVLTHCTVRACAMEKGYQACIECDELVSCDKALWTRFPQFHEGVVKMQAKYREQS
ncbi:MAG: DUF3795 domain-containing protein [Bacteroidales bacterium]